MPAEPLMPFGGALTILLILGGILTLAAIAFVRSDRVDPAIMLTGPIELPPLPRTAPIALPPRSRP